MGYDFRGPIPGFGDTYLMVRADHPRTQKRAYPSLTERLVRDDRVVWAEQQFTKPRQKRDFNRVPPDDGPPLATHGGAVPRRRPQLRYAPAELAARAIYRGAPEANDTLPLPLPLQLADKLGCSLEQPGGGTPAQRARLFNDELWSKQWYLMDTRTRLDLPKLDLHVLPVYCRGITGRGVRVTVLDDGMETDHEDLRDNYVRPRHQLRRQRRRPGPDAALRERRQQRARHALRRRDRHEGQQPQVRRRGGVQRQDRGGASAGRRGQRPHGGHGAGLGAHPGGHLQRVLGAQRRRHDGGGAGPAGPGGHEAGRHGGPRRQGLHLRVGLGQRRHLRRQLQLRRLRQLGVHAGHRLGVGARPLPLVRRALRVHHGDGLLVRRLLGPDDRHHGPQEHVHHQAHRHVGGGAPRGRHHRPGPGSQPGADVARRAASGGQLLGVRPAGGQPRLAAERRGLLGQHALRLRTAQRGRAGAPGGGLDQRPGQGGLHRRRHGHQRQLRARRARRRAVHGQRLPRGQLPGARRGGGQRGVPREGCARDVPHVTGWNQGADPEPQEEGRVDARLRGLAVHVRADLGRAAPGRVAPRSGGQEPWRAATGAPGALPAGAARHGHAARLHAERPPRVRPGLQPRHAEDGGQQDGAVLGGGAVPGHPERARRRGRERRRPGCCLMTPRSHGQLLCSNV